MTPIGSATESVDDWLEVAPTFPPLLLSSSPRRSPSTVWPRRPIGRKEPRDLPLLVVDADVLWSSQTERALIYRALPSSTRAGGGRGGSPALQQGPGKTDSAQCSFSSAPSCRLSLPLKKEEIGTGRRYPWSSNGILLWSLPVSTLRNVRFPPSEFLPPPPPEGCRWNPPENCEGGEGAQVPRSGRLSRALLKIRCRTA